MPYNPEGVGGEALKERFGRGVSPRPSNPDSVLKAAHDWEAHFFWTLHKKRATTARRNLIDTVKFNFDS